MLLFLNIFITFCMFVIGSLFGSFFSLATYRLPRHQDIIATRSYCPNCKHRLGFFDLIPVLSYMIRGGKCKYCSDKISLRYFLLETVNGVVFVMLYLIFGYNLKLLVVCLIYAVIFLLIGSKVMKNKMSEEEIKEVEKEIIERKNIKLAKKSGVFISELVIAILLFITLVITALINSKNYNSIASKDILKSNAHMIAVKNIEMCLATKYDALASYDLEEKIGNVVYNVEVNVVSINQNEFSKEDIVKKIEVNVSYNFGNEKNTTSISTLKGKV